MSAPIIKTIVKNINLEIGTGHSWKSASLIEQIGTYTSDATGETVEVFLTLSRSRIEIRTADNFICRVPLEALMDYAADTFLDVIRTEGLRGPVSQPPVLPTSDVPPDPTAPGNPDPNCQRVLMKGDKPYPRTCAVCGLGPCHWPTSVPPW